MKQKIYICTNDEQLLCAKLAKFIIEKVNTHPINSIEIVHNRSFPVLKELSNQEYLRKGKREIYSPNDMQSFTFLRFAIPELMSFDGQALVIDPDIFLIKDAIGEVFLNNLFDADIACRSGIERNSWATSLMFLNCKSLEHWNLEDIIQDILSLNLDYYDLLNLQKTNLIIHELDHSWNDFDSMDERTKFLHLTQKITQPWRKGLKLNSYIPPIFGFIPRVPIYKILNKPINIGVDHPNKHINDFFFISLKNAYQSSAIDDDDIEFALAKNFIRKDIRSFLI
tara:strand:- start:1515 stop:2360 length:846 start_codon:yes stop_codon:yes gene_type:complete